MLSKLIIAPKKYYITTPIYYISDKMHLGHSYTTIAADIFARYYRMIGTDVFYLTGTDEHGLKIQQAAESKGITPKQLVDDLAQQTKDLWKLLDISYDAFIRTTDQKHEQLIQEIVQQMFDKGDIYLGDYEGWYCKGCESYFTEKEIKNGKCPIGHEVFKEKEKAYFFRLSKYQEWLLQYIEEHPDFLQPQSRKNEMLAFIKNGLEDLCISREAVSWGIKLPFDEKYTVYVWVDALFNYLSGLDYINTKEKYLKYWPPDLQLMGKEIFRFHTIYWPIFLKSVNLELPKIEFAHGWWTVEGQKMSKSFGNVIYPDEFIEKYNLDIYRYYLFREVSFGEDGSFSIKTVKERINNELVATLGNLFSRVLALAQKRGKTFSFFKDQLSERVNEKIIEIHKAYEQINLSKVLNEIFEICYLANKYVQENKPWELIENNPEKFDQIIYVLLETLRIIAVELSPIMTRKYKVMFEQLDLDPDDKNNYLLEFSNIMENKNVKKKDHIFKKVE